MRQCHRNARYQPRAAQASVRCKAYGSELPNIPTPVASLPLHATACVTTAAMIPHRSSSLVTSGLFIFHPAMVQSFLKQEKSNQSNTHTHTQHV